MNEKHIWEDRGRRLILVHKDTREELGGIIPHTKNSLCAWATLSGDTVKWSEWKWDKSDEAQEWVELHAVV